MTVLIVSHLFEPSVNSVIGKLESEGIPWVRLNCEELPLFAQVDVHITSAESYGIIRLRNATIDTRAVTSVWFRRVANPAVPKRLRHADKEFIRSETRALLDGIFDLLDCKWVNSRAAERASSKIRQLAVAAKCGFSIPRTVMSNDPDTVRDFRETWQDISFKPISGYSPRGADFIRHASAEYGDEIEIEPQTDTNAEVELVFNQILTQQRMNQIDSLKLCPATFQTYVRKVSDIRVTIVGRRIFACRILSQEHELTAIDFRRMVVSNDTLVKHEHIDLPTDVTEKLLSLMDELGLVFGCVDLLETKEGDFVFLEVNTSGQWMWIEQRLGYPISASIAEELNSTSL